MGLLPSLFSFTGVGNLIINIFIRFIIGLIVIKLLTIINDYFQNGVYFFIAAIFLEAFISKVIITFISAV